MHCHAVVSERGGSNVQTKHNRSFRTVDTIPYYNGGYASTRVLTRVPTYLLLWVCQT